VVDSVTPMVEVGRRGRCNGGLLSRALSFGGIELSSEATGSEAPELLHKFMIDQRHRSIIVPQPRKEGGQAALRHCAVRHAELP